MHLLTPDAHEHLVEVPAPMRGRAVRPQPACDQRAEGEDPAPDGLVGDLDAALGQELLDISVAEGAAQLHPDGAVDNVGWGAVAGAGPAGRSHAVHLRRTPAPGKLVT